MQPVVLVTPYHNDEWRQCAHNVSRLAPLLVDVVCWNEDGQWADTRLAGLALSLCATLVSLPEITVDPGPLRLACRGLAFALLLVFVARASARAEERRMLERALAGPERRTAGDASPG